MGNVRWAAEFFVLQGKKRKEGFDKPSIDAVRAEKDSVQTVLHRYEYKF